MSLLQAILLGIVQGVTEFLPVSSFGHFVILDQLFHISAENEIFFSVLLHTGTLLILIIFFRNDLFLLWTACRRMCRNIAQNIRIWLANRSRVRNEAYVRVLNGNYQKLLLLLLLSTCCTFLLGFLSRHILDAAAGNLAAVGLCFILTGFLMLVGDFAKNKKKRPINSTFTDAIWIGICQGIGLFPGISRLGITVLVALLCGFGRRYAYKYAFLLAIPTTFGALLLELTRLGERSVTPALTGLGVAGFLAALIVGFFVMRYLVPRLLKGTFRGFSIYSLAVGLLSLILYFSV